MLWNVKYIRMVLTIKANDGSSPKSTLPEYSATPIQYDLPSISI